MTNKYNGWTNYATWRINLEIFDGMTLEDMGWEDSTDPFRLGQVIQNYAEEVVLGTSDPSSECSLMQSYAYAFMNDVNWTEIASSMIENAKDTV